jgi:hypothetical protein
MIHPRSFVFRRRAIHPIRTAQSVEIRTEGPFEIGRGGHVANGNLGNGILRPETFDPPRRQWAAETVEWAWQTD